MAMLRRFVQRLSSKATMERATTYAESLLDQALPSTLQALDNGADPIESVSRALVAAEVAAGLPESPTAPDARAQFERTYATLLMDNDRLPLALQLSGDDLERPRTLLRSFFTGATTMQRDAASVLRFMEERFAEGYFGQARLLLQLFDTDPQTRRNNERNLWFEEMVLRFLSTRDIPMPTPDTTDTDTDEALSLVQVAELLHALYDIRLQTYSLDRSRDDAWHPFRQKLTDLTPMVPLGAIPGPRWRTHWQARDPFGCIREQMEFRGARAFVNNLTRCMYFVAVAPGATGYEHLIPKYFNWLEAHFDTVAGRILPSLHRLSTVEDKTITEAFDILWNDLTPLPSTSGDDFTDDELRSAMAALTQALADADLSSVPPGDYDLGGLVAMRLFDFEPGDIATALRINRVT